MQAEKKTDAGDVTGFGRAAVATGSLVDEQNPSRPDFTDGELRTSAAVNRLCRDAFVLRPLETARTMTRVGHKLGADVNRLRSDVFVLRILRLLSSATCRRRQLTSNVRQRTWRNTNTSLRNRFTSAPSL